MSMRKKPLPRVHELNQESGIDRVELTEVLAHTLIDNDARVAPARRPALSRLVVGIRKDPRTGKTQTCEFPINSVDDARAASEMLASAAADRRTRTKNKESSAQAAEQRRSEARR